VISGAAAEISAGPVRRKEGGRALPAVIRTPGALLEGRAGVGLGWLVALRRWGGSTVQRSEGRLKQRNLRRGEEGEADEVGSLVSGGASAARAGCRWRVGPAGTRASRRGRGRAGSGQKQAAVWAVRSRAERGVEPGCEAGPRERGKWAWAGRARWNEGSGPSASEAGR
jgi:hypothetical protein